ncbi:hypothetical protein [Kribbella sp. CA-293567]|uniref:hypothetical protein n=1 Tax=Kribbella sp. CA-293567 TaxID=3002436 RepID=UPI0022DE6DCB|nr:hypothetical protein [Kribbella sp. CA-293567]WBQ04962.1 hypothetical protein OX958_34040 [Kribbella sp. CA-293567]
MPVHVFVDETKSRGLLMAAARCQAGDVAVHRKALRGLLLPGQERLHFRHESDPRRKKILRVIDGFHILVDLYFAETDTLANRRRCLEAIVRDSAGTTELLRIERDESIMDHDRQAVHAAIQRFGCFELRFELLAPKADPLLWVPDAVAWIHGGAWRREVAAFSQLREL